MRKLILRKFGHCSEEHEERGQSDEEMSNNLSDFRNILVQIPSSSVVKGKPNVNGEIRSSLYFGRSIKRSVKRPVSTRHGVNEKVMDVPDDSS